MTRKLSAGYFRQTRRPGGPALLVFLLLFVLTRACGVQGGIVPPRGGGGYPEHYRRFKKENAGAFELRRGWRGRAIKQAMAGSSFRPLRSLGARLLSHPELALGGRLRFPVIPALYEDTQSPPYDRLEIERRFFAGPWPSGTLKDYFSEVSLGLLEVSGDVREWQQLSHSEGYYIGVTQGLTPGDARTGELIRELLEGLDSSIDFGAFDNDGPDGAPNSGDDDGFVDVIVITQPEKGAECDRSNHMWSHSWIYSGWPASGFSPYSTDDLAAGGGRIKIDDYIIAPANSCEGGIIEIGVYCHELGHTLGLPDLYDWNGGGSGIGYWGLMGAGNWNEPESPAHMCAWSKEQIGWVEPLLVDWREQAVELEPAASSGDVVKMVLPTRRFRRREYTQLEGGYGLVCGYTEAEADARGWLGGEGYGNAWRESFVRGFSTAGAGPVTLRFSVAADTEQDYDFGRLLLSVGDAVETLAVYTGEVGIIETISLEPFLPPAPSDFTLRFLFTSDFSLSDEDGLHDSFEAYSFVIDDVSLNGGGLDYSCDFESDAGGWRSDAEPAEYFLVEFRKRVGFDSKLRGEGLLVWHAENSIAYSWTTGNSGGFTGEQARGLVLEEADGRYELLKPIGGGGNLGNSGDPFPGSSGNRTFAANTTPDSRANDGSATRVAVIRIVPAGSSVSAYFRAGMPAPLVTEALPESLDAIAADFLTVDIRGENFQFGAEARLSREGNTVAASGTSWLGEEVIFSTFPAVNLYGGLWNIEVINADGQPSIGDVAVQVISNFLVAVETGRGSLDLEWSLTNTDGLRGCRLLRSAGGGAYESVAGDTLRSPTGEFAYSDSEVLPGIEYSYRIVAYYNGGEDILELLGPYGIDALPFMADQNFPNPFSANTRIGFFVPSRARVSVDLYDVSGRQVASIAGGEYERGDYEFGWEPPGNLSPGVYFCIFRSGGVKKVIKMVLVR